LRKLRNGSTRLALIGLLTVACSGAPDADRAAGGEIDLGPGVARSIAEHRARTISDLRYEIFLSIPQARGEAITGQITASFTLAETGQPLVFDFAQPAGQVRAITVNGAPATFEARDEHIVLPSSTARVGANEVTLTFTAGDGSLNRSDEFLYCLFVPDRARVALPIFDQPDLKARYRLNLELPTGWEAVTNSSLANRHDDLERTTLAFNESDPISTYLFAFAAGRFEVVTAERAGRRLRMLHRETDAEKVARNLEVIFDLHGTALEWLEEYTDIPYPFEKLDFVAVPAFQYGGMEHAGAIFYRDRSLFLEETATQSQHLGRASLIAHEVAHMWFGNLVTMQWFDDVWMKEVFANFMAAKIVNPSFPEVDHDLRFLLAHYPAAYRVDRTAGANPIRQELANLNEAGSLYGAIIYQKAPVVMKHLERLMGVEPFRDGLREYLEAHRYGNATWPDLIALMDRRTEEDLEAWSRVWVNEAGRPTIETAVDGSGSELGSIEIRQSDPAQLGRLWNQRLDVFLGDVNGGGRTISVHLRDRTAVLEGVAGTAAAAFVLANGGGVGYGNFVLDAASQSHLLRSLPALDSARVRAAAWLSLWDAMLEGRVAPIDLIELTLRAIPAETDELNIHRVLSYLETAYWRYLPVETRAGLAPRLEALLWNQLETTERTTLKGTYLNSFRDIVLTAKGIDRLRGLWSGEHPVQGLPLSENDTTTLAQALALRGIADAETVLTRERLRISNPDSQTRFDFVRPALSADPVVRDSFFTSLADEANRERERWVLEALSFLHHPLRADASEVYILPSLELLEEIQRTGDIFFPLGWLSATLGGHGSVTAAAVVRQFLDEHPDLPPQLRGKLLQAADPLFRAARIRHGESTRDVR